MERRELLQNPVITRMARKEEVVWINPKKRPFEEVRGSLPLSERDIAEASRRFRRFAPLLSVLFPETAPQGGVIESELTEIPSMRALLSKEGGPADGSRLFIKRDSDLAVAGSVKARGGIYEVLYHSEELALRNGLLSGPDDDYRKLASGEAKAFFRTQKIQVGSTGNLGVSIGIMSAALGYQAIVHMSSDAKQWKKDYLRSHGVTVVEYEGDYGEAVARGRAESDADPNSYFVDDENSRALFLGYAASAANLKKQLASSDVHPDEAHPLFVTIPCGVGGAPGGIAFGLKHVFGDSVHVFFAEPTEACSMLLGLTSGLHSKIDVRDIGLSGRT
ncbi:MAG: D-serine ammonia-lyase, partial [Lachnospiraceae bacterium]|nr:D-serine ammonia-lyase [Lachnospiraceae bacterium]